MSTEENEERLNWPTWVGLVVEDLEAQRRYYRDVVGLREWRVGEGYVIFDVGSKKFELLAQSTRPQYACKGFHVGFAVANLEAVRAELISRGIEPAGDIESDAGSSWCYFKDPEGNLYQIAEG
jgi:catechol-2,3-dioxygenase